MLEALRAGASEVEVASAVSFAAATRIARFPTSNEFGDWDTALHTFIFANAVEQGLRRSPSPELLRGVLDAAVSVYLDRFLSVPATRLPVPEATDDPDQLLAGLPDMLDRQQQVDDAARLAMSFLDGGGKPEKLVAALGRALAARTATSTRSNASRPRSGNTSSSRGRTGPRSRSSSPPASSPRTRRPHARSGRPSRSPADSTAASSSTTCGSSRR